MTTARSTARKLIASRLAASRPYVANLSSQQESPLIAPTAIKPTGLARFVEATSNYSLDSWQYDLCRRLEELATTTGRRLLISAPPQYGKSVIVSQRFPAWLLAQQPINRIKLACYNVTHAIKFSVIVRNLVQSDAYAQLFPAPGLRLPKVTVGESWSNFARLRLDDGQPSFKALGLQTGFVGEGGDTLIIDDPYASPEHAYSPQINGKVHSFWSDTAKPRLNERTNVVVMFHRYHEYDLAGWLMEQEPDEWELVRYSAVADGAYAHPETKREYPDPLGRQEGEKLSGRFSDQWLAKQSENTFVWLSQFQGRPTAKGGLFFKSEWFEIVGAVPARSTRVRYWDTAGADDGKGDWTVGVLIAKSPDGIYYVEDVERFQKTAHPRNERMKQVAELDRQAYGEIETYVEQPPGLAKESTSEIIKQLAGYWAYADPVTGSKELRANNPQYAESFKAQCEAGNVKLVSAPWNRKYLDELCAFPAGKHDDQVDASSGAFRKLTQYREPQQPAQSYSSSRFR